MKNKEDVRGQMSDVGDQISEVEGKSTAKCQTQKGITLIALIITVIILLILAGTAITIGLNGGDLFGHANNAVEKWNNKIAQEEHSINEVLNIINPPPIIYADDKLIIDISNTTATDAEKSPYINYRWKDGEEPILCRVLYDKNDGYGVQIVSVNPVRKVQIGSNREINAYYRLGEAVQIYNNAIKTLNQYAENYIDSEDKTGIVKDARCVGTNPGDKNDEGEMKSFNIKVNGSRYNYQLRCGDDNGAMDETRLEAIGAIGFSEISYGNSYWFATRRGYYRTNTSYVENWGPGVRRRDTAGTEIWDTFFYITNSAPAQAIIESGLRPVFTLNTGVKILSGDGTLENPYELGI